MTTLTLTISEADREFIEAQVSRGGHDDAVAYLLKLINRDRARADRAEADRRALVASLQEALREEAVEMTTEDWDAIRREARAAPAREETAVGADADEG